MNHHNSLDWVIGMELKKICQKVQHLKLLSLLTALSVLCLFLVPTAVTASSDGGQGHPVILSGGEHGQIRFGGNTSRSQTFTVAHGGALPDGIEVVPDSGYVLSGFRFSAKIKKFCSSNLFAYVLTEDGKVYAAGDNTYGQLGLGDTDTRIAYTEVTSLSGKKVVDIHTGYSFALALTEDGKVFATGRNSDGQLGLGDEQNRHSFTEVTSLSGKNITHIGAGEYFALAAASDHTVYGAGRNMSSQLGLGDRLSRNSFTEIPSLREKTVTAIAAGGEHTFVLTTDGLYVTGDNTRGTFGLGHTTNLNVFTEVPFFRDKTIADIAIGSWHAAVVTSDGTLYVAGWNYYSQLGYPGTGLESKEINFIIPEGMADKNIIAVETGNFNTVAITSEGQVYISGWSQNFQLGVKHYSSKKFDLVSLLSAAGVTGLAIGPRYSLVAASDGSLYSAGYYGGMDPDAPAGPQTKITDAPWFFHLDSLADIAVNHGLVAETLYQYTAALNLSSSPAAARYPQNILLTAAMSSLIGTSGKTVSFYSGDMLLGSAVTDASGQATFEIDTPDAGGYTFRAAFAGDSVLAPAGSNTVSCTVGQAEQDAVSLAGIPAHITYGDEPFSVSLSGGSGDGAVTYGSGNPEVATVDNSGKVTIVGAGTFTITATKGTSRNYREVSITSSSIPVYKKALTADDLLYSPPASLIYDGSVKQATVTLKSGVVGAGAITVKYYLNGSGVPQAIDSGAYTVTVDVAEGSNYLGLTDVSKGSFTIDNASQSKPEGLSAVNPTTLANNDGKITGVSALMEYQKSGETGWTPVTGTEITGLSNGSYYVRYAARSNYNASEWAELTLTECTGTPEETPTAVFDAATRTLSGTQSGQKYRIDGGPWTDVADDLSAEVTKACTIELYMPGDGVYTLDSGIQTITVTKAEKPDVSGVHESFQGKNDGKMTGVDITMEYRTTDGDWTDVPGQVLEGLAPGTYYVRIKATGTTLESDAAEVTITAGEPEFTEKTLTDNTGKVSVTGQFTKDAALQASPVAAGSESFSQLVGLADTKKNTVLAAYEISVTGGYSGKLSLTFHVDTVNNGKTFTIYHQNKNGEISQYTAVCTEGRVVVQVDELSPFLLTVPAAADSGAAPPTGDAGILTALATALFAAALAFLLFLRRRRPLR